MKLHKRIIDSLIILTGPAGTTILYVGGEAGNIDAEGVVRILFSALGLMVVAVLVSVLIHSHISQFRRAMWVSVISTIIIRLPLAYWFASLSRSAQWPAGNPDSLYWSLLIAWVSGAAVTAWLYSRGRWRKRAEDALAANTAVPQPADA